MIALARLATGLPQELKPLLLHWTEGKFKKEFIGVFLQETIARVGLRVPEF
jgi:hypothetical protein